MDDQHAPAVLCEREDGVAIQRRERAKIEYRGLDPICREPLRDSHRRMHVRAVRDQRDVISMTPQGRASDWNRRGPMLAKHLLDPGIAIERDVLVVENGIRIRD